jgi:hypothetical protein
MACLTGVPDRPAGLPDRGLPASILGLPDRTACVVSLACLSDLAGLTDLPLFVCRSCPACLIDMSTLPACLDAWPA